MTNLKIYKSGLKKDVFIIMDIHFFIANVNILLRDHKEAEKHLLETMKIAYKRKKWKSLERGAKLLTKSYINAKRFDRALLVYKIYLHHAKKSTRTKRIVDIYLRLGIAIRNLYRRIPPCGTPLTRYQTSSLNG